MFDVSSAGCPIFEIVKKVSPYWLNHVTLEHCMNIRTFTPIFASGNQVAQAAVERANEGLGSDDVNRRCCFFGAAENQFVLFSESWYKIERRQLELNRSLIFWVSSGLERSSWCSGRRSCSFVWTRGPPVAFRIASVPDVLLLSTRRHDPQHFGGHTRRRRVLP